jgi:hypothetical protein
MNDQTETPEQARQNQMDSMSMGSNIEYRLQRLEEERLPHRVSTLEFNVAQIQGEVVAVKEIARGIGTKLDSGINGLERSLSAEIDKLQMDQAKNQSFIRGVVWVGGGLVTLVSLAPLAGEALKKLLGV